MNPNDRHEPLPIPNQEPVGRPPFDSPAQQPVGQQPVYPTQQMGSASYSEYQQPTTPTPTPTALGAVAAQSNPQLTPTGEPYPLDYLNQIAPTEKRSVNRFAVIALIGGVLVAVAAVLVIIATSGPPDFSTQAKSVQSRMTTLQTVADAQQTHLKEGAISEANSSLASALTSMNTELGQLMKSKGIKKSNGTASVTEKDYATKLAKKLDDSHQRGTLDRTYATQMTYELTVLRSRLSRLKNIANSKSVTTFANSAIGNIDVILKAYGAFTATK